MAKRNASAPLLDDVEANTAGDVDVADEVDECPDCGGDKNAGDCTCGDEIGQVHIDDGDDGPASTDEQGNDADDVSKTPIAELLSPIALQGVSAKMKKKSLSSMSNEWVQNTFARLSGLVRATPDALEADDWRSDLRFLELTASARDLTLTVPARAIAPDVPATAPRPLGNNWRSDSTPAAAGDPSAVIVDVPLGEIAPDPTQARDEGADDELADSIKVNGVLQPIELRHTLEVFGGVKYVIVDGERRFLGAKKVGHTHIRATITDQAATEGDRLIRQVVRNDGKRLKPMEEARTFKRIMADKGWTIQQLATHLGKSKTTVSDRVAMADAPAVFQPLFEDGSLSAAAAPVVRKYEHLPAAVLAILVERATDDYGWKRHTDAGKTIPLGDVANTLERATAYTFPQVAKGVDFDGETFTVDKQAFAVDRQAYHAAEAKHRRERASEPGKAKPDAAATKYQADEKRRRDVKTKKTALRVAQFHAISAKLPVRLDSGTALLAIRAIAEEMQQPSQIAACKALGIMPERKSTYGPNFVKILVAHATKMDGGGRVKLLLQLCLASELQVGEYDSSVPDRLIEAARLMRVDLKKVKTIDATKPAPAITSTKPVFVKSSTPIKTKATKGRRPNAQFMRPMQVSEQLAAVIGKGPMVRTEVTKKLWSYIKRNDLQDKKERRMLIADEKLLPVFGGKKRVSMFEMTKLINKHLK